MYTIFANLQELQDYQNAHKDTMKLVAYKGTVYDVTLFLEHHPGGADIIEWNLGQSIDKVFKEANHSKSARLMFKQMRKVG